MKMYLALLFLQLFFFLVEGGYGLYIVSEKYMFLKDKVAIEIYCLWVFSSFFSLFYL